MTEKITEEEIKTIIKVLKIGLITLNTSTNKDKEIVSYFHDNNIILKLIDNLI